MASPDPGGSAKSMADSRAEALKALLASLAPGAEAHSSSTLNDDQARRLSDKLSEILGEAAVPDSSRRNAKGEILNEEGLPIVDIVEPVPALDETARAGSASIAPTAEQDPEVTPIWTLSPAEQARRRAEQARLLDALEEEERVQTEKDEEEGRERFAAELEQRKKAAEAEMDALKKARSMQKKMGKALLANFTASRDRQEKEKLAEEEREKQEREERRKLKPKKSVTFADLPPDHELQPANSPPMPPPPFDWGDVAPGNVQAIGKSPLLTRKQMDLGPMRMKVVERHAKMGHGPKSPPPPDVPQDSDDESDPGSDVPADSDDANFTRSDLSDETPPSNPPDSSDESDYGVVEDKEPVEWDDESYDFAQHQREIALAYYEKRGTIGAEALAAMRNHEHTEDDHEWNQPVSGLACFPVSSANAEIHPTLSSAPPKPSISKFKASLPSTSLGSSILPVSETSKLKAAVRLGKVEGGNLIGGEDDHAAKEVLEMLKRGEVTNLGPTPSDTASNGSTSSAEPSPSTALPRTPRAKPSKISQFKKALTEPNTPASPSAPGSSLPTPVNSTGRSSPKSSYLSGSPIAVPSKTPFAAGSSQRSPEAASVQAMQMPGMIVASPSFPGPAGRTAFAPMDMVLESPSFSSPGSTVVGTPVSSTSSGLGSRATSPAGMPLSGPMSASVLERRRPIVSTEVREAGPGVSRSAGPTPTREKKVSRFLAERM
ncbi:uncharacterized protein BXZ73DRAFT_86112 [Epithele typhae]|uniref:uncharacterized protein n=1 Tax=Epithele typhae TaxID=378194 RepID=UPI002007856F|nr:uncharacterized protein BXZ73DRAFT_86112 [Epithele typhae]KAH9945858.1 hypothetical protein BXZ73DRAFT_86112 [Epithele typhae]